MRGVFRETSSRLNVNVERIAVFKRHFRAEIILSNGGLLDII